MAKKIEKLTFEDGLAKLERIVAEMEEGKLGLNKMLEKFGEGMELAKFCGKWLETAEKKVEILVRKQDGSLSSEPFEPEESEEEEGK
jgi:exodeoxyribonuclease VII small subunit